MAIFKIGDPVETEEPVVSVEFSEETPLLPGSHIFELVVIDNGGNASDPARARILVIDPGPTAVLDAPEEATFGHSFELSGRRSSDIPPGRIVRYVWTLVESENPQ
jgi:hypothetical protein